MEACRPHRCVLLPEGQLRQEGLAGIREGLTGLREGFTGSWWTGGRGTASRSLRARLPSGWGSFPWKPEGDVQVEVGLPFRMRAVSGTGWAEPRLLPIPV